MMRVAILRGARDVVVEDRPVPEPGRGEVVLRVDAALTGGTDAKVYRRGYHARMLAPPCPIGHEYAGTVAVVGAGVTTVSEGDAVVGGNSAPCGECRYCKEDREALCDDLLFVNGAFAEWLLLPSRVVERNLHARPGHLAPLHAAATEPVACVLKGMDVATVLSGESVLILGSGPIACVFASLLAAEGAPAAMLARSDDAATTGRAMGAGLVVVGTGPVAARDALLASSADGDGFDLVIEAAGAAETTEAAPSLCRKGGRVLLFGGCAADVRVPVAPARLHYDEIDLLSSFHHTPHYVARALDAIANGRVDLEPLLEDPVGVDGVANALERMCAREIRGKVPVLPGGAA